MDLNHFFKFTGLACYIDTKGEIILWHIIMLLGYKPSNIITDSFDTILDKNINIDTEYMETEWYIKSVLKRFQRQNIIEKQSMSIMFLEAVAKHNFSMFQDVGDYTFFVTSIFPESIDLNLYYALGKRSYYECYKRLKPKWVLYEELSDRFDYFAECIINSGLILDP